MSETEHHRGKLTEIEPNEGEGVEALAKRLLDENNIPFADYYDNYSECLQYDSEERFIAIKGKIYKCETAEIDTNDDILNANRNADGTIDFEIKYYNGGCGFSEAIESAIDIMDKDQDTP